MRITSEILIALNTAIKKAGSQAEFARRSGVNPVYIGRYLNGKNKKISLQNQVKIWPLIKDFLPENFVERYESEFDIEEMQKTMQEMEDLSAARPLIPFVKPDGLFIEFARHWSKFDVEQKLTALVYVNQISRGELGFGTRKK